MEARKPPEKTAKPVVAVATIKLEDEEDNKVKLVDDVGEGTIDELITGTYYSTCVQCIFSTCVLQHP